jgi:hypothetical protein
MRRRLIVVPLMTVVVAVVVAGTAHRLSTRRAAEPPPVARIDEEPPAGPIAAARTQPSIPSDGPDEPDALPPKPRLSDEERVVLIKRAIAKNLSEPRETYVEALAASGLAPADGERIAQQLVDRVADCMLEAARAEYESRGVGLKEFLDAVEIAWSQQPRELNVDDLHQVQARAAPCIAAASEQAGIPTPSGFGRRADELVERFSAGLESPPWAGDMEARLRAHIASYPELMLTGTLIKCRADGCNVMLEGHDIHIFELELDRFAEQNGFARAALGGDSDRRFVWLER